MHSKPGTMVLVSDSEQIVADPDQDIRGRKVSRTRVEVAEAPQYNPTLIDGEKFFAALYRHYG